MSDINRELSEVIENLIKFSFEYGFAAGVRCEGDRTPLGVPMDVREAYADWRVYGPGATLPGAPSRAEPVLTPAERLRGICDHAYTTDLGQIIVCVKCGEDTQ